MIHALNYLVRLIVIVIILCPVIALMAIASLILWNQKYIVHAFDACDEVWESN